MLIESGIGSLAQTSPPVNDTNVRDRVISSNGRKGCVMVDAIAERFARSQQWVRRAEHCDAWAATRDQIVANDRFVDGAYPFYASHGHGAYVWDVDGNRYIDFILGYGPVVLGHADPRVMGAVVEELTTGTCLSPLWRPVQVELAELLVSVLPGAEMVFLMKTGSDATSGALRLARIYTGRSKVVHWGYNGWHDWTCPRLEGIPASVLAETLTFEYNDIASLHAVFEQHPDEIACVIMMPFEVDPPYPGFLAEVRDLAHDHGALFILDEMRSGFRMALGGAQQYFGVQADLATYSKAMANGYPISAIAGRRDVLQCIGRTHMASTFFANAAEMAAAVATVSILRDTDVIERVWAHGRAFQQGLSALVEEYAVPARVVGYPPSPFLEFDVVDDATRELAKTLFFTATTREGVLFHPNHHWFLSAAHTDEDIAATLQACRKGFEEVRRGAPNI